MSDRSNPESPGGGNKRTLSRSRPAGTLRGLDQTLDAIEVLLRLRRTADARSAIDALAHSFPDAVVLHLYRGWLALVEKRPDLAGAGFRLAAGRDPLEPLAWHGIAESTADAAERDAARERLRFLDRAGSHGHIWHELRSNRPHLAVTALHNLHRHWPARAEISIWLAETHRRLELDEQAGELVEMLMRRRPRPVPAIWLAAALAPDDLTRRDLLAEACRYDPLGRTARRMFPPDEPPFALPEPPLAPLEPEVALLLSEVPLAASPLQPPRAPAQTGPPAARTPAAVAAPKAAGSAKPAPRQAAIADRESNVALQAVEEATNRLLRRTPLTVENRNNAAIIGYHRGALMQAYGAAAATAIARAADQYAAALALRGVQAVPVAIDDPKSMARFPGSTPAANGSAAACAQAIAGVRMAIERGGDLDTVVLLGGDTLIPMHRLPNPSQDADENVPSDNPYGRGQGSELAPDVAVARFPDGGSDGGKLLLAQLERAADYHANWHLDGPTSALFRLPLLRRLSQPAAGKPVAAWGASTESWIIPSQAIYDELGSRHPLLICPPGNPRELARAWEEDARVLYFNLHGLPGGANWYGQAAEAPAEAALPVALTPGDVGEIGDASIVLTEACYGAEITGRTPANQLALRLLERGALAVVGSTVTAYGSVALPLGGADLLMQQTLFNLRRGYTIGQSLLLARDWMARETVDRQGYLDPDDAKTLMSFVLLGDPWATPYARPVLERKAILPRVQPVVVQRRTLPAELVAPQAIDTARQVFAKIAPDLGRGRLTAVGQGKPDRIAKGVVSTVVFSASDSLPTIDGRRLSRIARVTVMGAEARKLLLSR